jgi:plastocyanin
MSNAFRVSPALRWFLFLAVLMLPQVLRAQWHASVGAQSSGMGHQALAFLPNEMWIHAGDSITWNFGVDEIHTLTFLTPGQVRLPFPVGCPGFSGSPASFDGSVCISTPPLVKGASFTVMFPKAGNYRLVCLVHQNMTGVVHVLDTWPLPHDQSFYDREAVNQRKDLLLDRDEDRDAEHDHGGADADESRSAAKAVTAGVGEIVETGGGAQTLSIMRFLHSTKTIHVGETVEWTITDLATPHTITFGTEPGDVMHPTPNVVKDADGALHVWINSVSDSAHSGFLMAAPQDRIGLPQSPLTVTHFRVTFMHAGTYNYICALHDNLGMKGKIVVLP